IGVEISKYVSFCFSKSGIKRISLPIVSLREPSGKKPFILSDLGNGVVGASAVHNYILEVRVTLEKDRPDRLLDKLALVIVGCHDRYTRPGFALRHCVRKLWALDRPRPTGFPGRRGRQLSQGRAAHDVSSYAAH